jgi:hypothetical protein
MEWVRTGKNGSVISLILFLNDIFSFSGVIQGGERIF